MKKLFIFFRSMTAIVLTFMVALVMPMVLMAQLTAPPETVDGATSLVPKLIEALVAGNHLVAGGIVLMILMVAVRQYALPKWKISSDLLPIVTAIIGALSAAGLSMMNSVPVEVALKNGVIMALLAGGAWSLLGKYVAKLVLGDGYQDSQASK